MSRTLIFTMAAFAAKGANAITVDPAEFGFSPDAAPDINAAALQKALDGGKRMVKVSRPGEYRLDRTMTSSAATERGSS